MSCTSVSTFVANSIPVVTERCGEVYCSLDLENFLINCLRCSQEFNLLSCNLFIKHIKECLSVALHDPSEHNPLTVEEHNLTNDFSAKEEFKETEYENHQVDPLISIKQEKEEVNDVKDENPCDDAEYLSDYQIEDDLPLEKLAQRKIVEGIISEFKKHPILWDNKMPITANREIKKQNYKKIRKAVNSKYKTSYTAAELRKQMYRMSCCYRRALRRKIEFEKQFPEGTAQFKTKLWYFDKLSFIEGTSQDNEIDLTKNSDTEQEQNETDKNESDSSGDITVLEYRKKRDRPNYKILNEPKIIFDIISQYKQYPFLWDQTNPLYNNKHARKDAYRKITNSINQKFYKKVTDKEIKRQIINLRTGYRRAQRKKHKAKYRVNLWYYDELSFIDNKAKIPENLSNEANPSEDHEEVLKKIDDPINNHSMDSGENNENLVPQSNNEYDDDDNFTQNDPNDSADVFNDAESNPSSSKENNKRIILGLIEEYKKHPCLWDSYKYKVSGRFNRYDALKEIMSAVNTKFNTSFTEKEVRDKIVRLRSSYRRVLRNKEAFEKKHANAKRKFFPQLWYFDKITFIGAKESDFVVSRKKKKKNDGGGEKHDELEVSVKNKTISDEEMDYDSAPECNSMKSEVHEENSSSELQEEHSSKSSITENKPLLRAIIEEYKKKPCLWNEKPDKTTWKLGLDEICSIINQKFNTKFNYRDLDREITALTSVYKRMLLTEENSSNDELWYSDLLSFIKSAASSEAKESCNQSNEYLDIPDEKKALIIENLNSGNEEVCQRDKVNTKEIVFKIIELYECERPLWDTNHPKYVFRNERKKCVERIIAKLSEENDCQLTVEEFRYQIRFLKQSYLRTLRHEITAKQGNFNSKYLYKPFFFDKMSFLEPFVDKNPMTVPVIQTEEKKQTEDFTFLCEKKSLMIDFIELYKENSCLWDQKHRNRHDSSAHTEAYNKIINMFKQNGEDFTEERVRSAIKFLHSSVVNPEKNLGQYDTNNTKESHTWFLEHLKFLGKIPRYTANFCSHCNQYFRSLGEFEKHKIEVAGDYPYKCEVCNAGFVSRSKYAYHQITHKEPHKCEQCGFQAFDKHNFNVHMRRHKGIHMFRCDECDKGFVTSTELNRHLRTHTGEKPFVCEICGKALVANSEFYHHMKRHRNQRDHKCDVCDSAFFTAKTLKDHMASHSSERQHVCEVCGSAFKRQKTLHQHKALHLEKKKHECNICGKRFAQKAGLYSHMKSHGQTLGS